MEDDSVDDSIFKWRKMEENLRTRIEMAIEFFSMSKWITAAAAAVIHRYMEEKLALHPIEIHTLNSAFCFGVLSPLS